MKDLIEKIHEAEVETVSYVLEKFGAEMTPVKIKGQEKQEKKHNVQEK